MRARSHAARNPRGHQARRWTKTRSIVTDEESRIMPTSRGGFEQSYNAQAAVDTDTMLVVAQHVTQAPNDQREIAPTLKQVLALPGELGQVTVLLADTGYYSAANVSACQAQGIAPMLAVKRESHHVPVLERFAADAPTPDTNDPAVTMAHRLGTQAGRALYGLRKQTVEPVFGIIKRVMGWSQMSMRGLAQARGEWSLVTMAWNIKRLHVLRAT
jgi:Transposase DDE domain